MVKSTFAIPMNDWLHNAAFPLWLDRGVDRIHGGFHELLSLEAARSAADYKRVRVIARQIALASVARLMRCVMVWRSSWARAATPMEASSPV
jgi:mannose/cellobiose epimerase-like protein (N-acyl-D-glucosamine 2-epimerase family)